MRAFVTGLGVGAALLAASPAVGVMPGELDVPGPGGGKVEYRVSLAPVIGSPSEIDLWIDFANHGSLPVEFIACISIAFEEAAEGASEPIPLYRMVLSDDGALECRPGGVASGPPGYHLGCNPIRIPPGAAGAPGRRWLHERSDLARRVDACEADAIRLDLLPVSRGGARTRVGRSCINAFSTEGRKGRANIRAVASEKDVVTLRGRASACAAERRDTSAPTVKDSKASWSRRTGTIAFEVAAIDDEAPTSAAVELQVDAGATEYLPLGVAEHALRNDGGARTDFRGSSDPLASGASVVHRFLVSDAAGNVSASDWEELSLGAGEKPRASMTGPEVVTILGIAFIALLCLRLVLRNHHRIDPPPLHPDDREA